MGTFSLSRGCYKCFHKRDSWKNVQKCIILFFCTIAVFAAEPGNAQKLLGVLDRIDSNTGDFNDIRLIEINPQNCVYKEVTDLREFDGFGGISSLAFDPKRNWLVISTFRGKLYQIDPISGNVTVIV